ncbi:hypothetical protein BV22DRAFT_1052297 [Leucogyrophana mollusca]|uniref:Uncharacterized protein n=1 Tax=Leucogyrophana mollusca TaxID=85980 RepID=A0ACB8AWJ6_9AGAM|nr:hypothetical protein BV22DRAFT_1052297 [Leucogyrophana mollusca]
MIAGWLLANHKVTSEEHATYHWKGIPERFRNKVETRLLASDPLRDMSTPFPVAEVEAAAGGCLQGGRFDTDLVYSDGESDIDSDSSSNSDEESETSDSSDSDDERRKSHRKVRKAKKVQSSRKKRVSTPKSSTEDESHTTRTSTKPKATRSKATTKPVPQDEVEDLIQQLNKMSIDDNRYGLLYFRACKLDSEVKSVVRAPKLQDKSGPTTTTTRNVWNPNVNGSNNSSAPSSTPAPRSPSTAPYVRRIRCYGCGQDGHSVNACPDINRELTKGTLVRDAQGKVALPGGRSLRRQGEETLIQALQHETTKPKTHLVTLDPSEERWVHPDSDDDEEEVYVVPADASDAYDEEVLVYPAERTMRGRDEKGKENKPPATVPTPVRTGPSPAKPVVKGDERPIKAPEVVSKRSNSDDDDDVIMEDSPIRKGPVDRKGGERLKGRKQESNVKVPNEDLELRRNNPKRSDVAAHVDSKNVLNRLLGTPVQIAIGDVLGVSKELSGVLMEAIKPKSVVKIDGKAAEAGNTKSYQGER